MSLAFLVGFLLVAYQLKHFVADYLLQGEYMLGKFKPGWDFLGPLLAHVGTHFIYSVMIANMLVPWRWALLIGLFDATVHFFMDRIKAGPKYMGRWKPLTGPEYVEAKKILARTPNDKADPLHLDQWLAEKQLRGNRNFWWALGFDQAVHHLTHYACIYFILRIGGWL